MEERIEELEEKLALKDEKIKRLHKKLRKYRNPHTPSSKKRGSSKSKSSSSGGGSRGRKRGHEGTTREKPDPEQTVVVEEENCPECGSALEDPKEVESRVIEDIPEPEPVVAKEYRIGHYECEDCGEEVVASHPDCPEEGRFGKNVLIQATLLKYEERIPYRKVSDLFEWQYDFEVSPASVLDFVRRTSDWLQPRYEKIWTRIRNSDVLHVDETGMKVDGEQHWIWAFTTGGETLVALRKSRGKKVLKEVLGKDFDGIIVCDGWSSYATYVKNVSPGADLQRCWAHLLREVEDLADKCEEAEPISEKIHEIYENLTGFVGKDPPPKEREKRRKKAEKELEKLLNKSYENERVEELIGKIKNGKKHWFTFVTEPGVEPTNNQAERALREHVVHRKIIGGLRSEKGMKIHETIMTLLTTWKQQGLDPYKEMVKATKR
ncbi:transposase [candidate division MSBL1 archaeon SCGC-AAA382M17]|uniref:Transposase n=1 Tax=candidate division MSBL1 archaeon SCGC-AAA382M17 TaxID=1698284 RepID=A0ABR5TJN9_9EURY|nr:transposase [candidate division MSBL1 archaeon SCGC-AAA382M17]